MRDFYRRLNENSNDLHRYKLALRKSEMFSEADASRLIRIISVSEAERFEMAKDADRTVAFNKDVERWADDVARMLRLKIQSRSQSVARDLKATLFVDKYGIINRVGFSFPRHGIYIHKGAGRGQGGWIGSKWEKLKEVNGVTVGTGIVRHTDPASLGKQGTGNRQAYPWFDTTIRAHIHRLEEIALNYFDTMIIDATRIYVDR